MTWLGKISFLWLISVSATETADPKVNLSWDDIKSKSPNIRTSFLGREVDVAFVDVNITVVGVSVIDSVNGGSVSFFVAFWAVAVSSRVFCVGGDVIWLEDLSIGIFVI